LVQDAPFAGPQGPAGGLHPSGLKALLQGRRLLFTVGPGGVGKTTVAAALGIFAARQGYRTLVMTVDPARRLAGALGLARLGNAPEPIAASLLGLPAANEIAGKCGSLHAAMVDTKASFDALVRRFAPPERVGVLTANRMYDSFSRNLSRSHAYASMERVHEAMTSPEYDLVIVDTPPFRSALEMLDAPERLITFLEGPVLRYFAEAAESLVQGGGGTGSSWVRSALAALFGKELYTEFSEFLGAFLPLRDGFVSRSKDLMAALRAPTTAFVMVTAPEPGSLADARTLALDLRQRNIVPDMVLASRALVPFVHGRRPVDARPAWSAEDVAENLAPELMPELAPNLTGDRNVLSILQAASEFHGRTAERNLQIQGQMVSFSRELGVSTAPLLLPRLAHDVRGMDDLLSLLAWEEARISSS
jgi:anion-transporting  ArsA/GET3 family ATPase